MWPGANFVLVAKDGGRKSLKYGDRRRTAAELKVSCAVAVLRALMQARFGTSKICVHVFFVDW